MKVLRPKSKTLTDLLSPVVMEKLLAVGTRRKFADGQIVQERGDPDKGLAIVTKGQVIAGNVGRDGSFLPSALLRPGETFGENTLFADLPRTHTLWANGPTEISFIRQRPFMKLFDETPSIAAALLTLTLLRNHEMIEFMDGHRRLPLRARLARLLLGALEEDDKDQSCERRIECRQEDLAYMLGVSRVAIGKVLKVLERDGILKLGYGYLTISRPADLAAMVAAQEQLDPVT